MWLATKEAAKGGRKRNPHPATPPATSQLLSQLGPGGMIRYKRLFEDYPQVERRDNEPLEDHLRRLEKAHQTYVESKGVTNYKSPLEAEQRVIKPDWLRQREQEEQKAPAGPALPGRDPGWYTKPDAGVAGYGVPPLPHRDPMATFRQDTTPTAVPPQQSMDEWLKFLADKGIQVDQNLKRIVPQPAPEPAPQYPGRHRQVRPGPGRHRAAMVVTAYIDGVLAEAELVD